MAEGRSRPRFFLLLFAFACALPALADTSGRGTAPSLAERALEPRSAFSLTRGFAQASEPHPAKPSLYHAIRPIPAFDCQLVDDRLLMIAYALDWLGTPYKYAGTTREGVDCSGFVAAVIAECFGDRFVPPRTSKGFAGFGEPLEGDPAPGDLLIFGYGGKPAHVGISLGDKLFVHAASEHVTGVIVSSLDEPYWKGYFMFARRFLPAPEGL